MAITWQQFRQGEVNLSMEVINTETPADCLADVSPDRLHIDILYITQYNGGLRE